MEKDNIKRENKKNLFIYPDLIQDWTFIRG